MDTTQHLELPYILAAQAQKHVTHNEALLVLDHVVQLAAEDRDLASPPPAPAEGQRFIVAAGATGAWSGRAGQIAAWQDGAWVFYSPQEGWLCFVRDEDRAFVWTGAGWIDSAALIATLQNLSLLGVGTTADAQNPFSAKLNNALWTAKAAAEGGTGDLRYTMNKESAAKTLSLLMQTNWSGRAEIGLTGDDKLHVKVSADGSTWKEAMVADPATGYLGIGTDMPVSRCEVYGNTNAASAQIKARAEGVAGSGGGILLHYNNTGGAYPLAGDRLGYVLFGTTQAGTNKQGGGIVARAEADYSDTSWPTYFAFETSPVGVTVPRVERLRITAGGNVGIGTPSPSCALDVAGPVRVAQYAKAALPSAAACGAGAMVYVSDEIGGAVIAFSDGTNWRRVTDRAVVG